MAENKKPELGRGRVFKVLKNFTIWIFWFLLLIKWFKHKNNVAICLVVLKESQQNGRITMATWSPEWRKNPHKFCIVGDCHYIVFVKSPLLNQILTGNTDIGPHKPHSTCMKRVLSANKKHYEENQVDRGTLYFVFCSFWPNITTFSDSTLVHRQTLL